MISHRQLFFDHLAQTSDFPMGLEVAKAEGIYVYDPDGKKHIDLISGIGVSSFGHANPQIMQAVIDQVKQHMHVMVYGEFIQSPQTLLAKALTESLPKSIDNVYFVNSGSEAVEASLKLAKRYTGRSELISCYKAYHGSTHGALSVTGDEKLKQPFRPLLPGIRHIGFGLEEDLQYISRDTAAIIIETIQGEAGVKLATTEYFRLLRKKCDETGTLLIMDEIQCGFGRTGKMWAFEHYGIVPDIVLSAKAMGGGMPIGAMFASEQIMSVFKNNPILGHITTFGGHPVSAAASLAAFNELKHRQLYQQAEEKANLFKAHLDHPEIREIRNMGLMMAVEFSSFDQVKAIVDRSLEMGLITDWFLFCDNAIRIAPPLIITEEEIIAACKILTAAIDAVS